MIELLVIMGIIGVLTGLLLPAVQSSRESARRAQCQKNLKELITAAHSFETSLGGFPPAWSLGPIVTRGDPHLIGSYSLQCLLLPYLEYKNIYNNINFDYPLNSISFGEQSTVATQSIDAFLCPSEPDTSPSPYGVNSYRACIGLGEMKRSRGSGIYIDGEGAFSWTFLPLSAISDGLSNTLAFSEKPVGTGDGGGYYSAFRDWVDYHDRNGSEFPPDWHFVCSNLNKDILLSRRLDAGRTWMLPGAVYTLFYASEVPNTLIPDCGSKAFNFGVGVFASRSYHPGGVNAALADGSVRWFSSGVDRKLWRGLGTRAGGEVGFSMP